MPIIETRNLSFDYIRRDEEGNVAGIVRAVNGVNIDINKGDFVAILGGNGSGKSTLAKQINAILYPTEGYVLVDGMKTTEEENILSIRQKAGMIFQNPDNQIIGSIVEEDVGFGPENMGLSTEEIWERVNESLKILGMEKYRSHSPMRLSGGQKQRVAIAGVMAMHPECIIMDEPTAMLDPSGRREVIRAARALNDVERVTVILITHYMEEVIHADRVIVMEKGEVKMAGTPAEIFSRVEELEALRLGVPQATKLAYELKKKGLSALSEGILSEEQLVAELSKYRKAEVVSAGATVSEASESSADGDDPTSYSLILDHVDYVYSKGTNDEIKALDDIQLTVKKGEYIGLIGHTGSGKSTLVQHMNGLLRATSGTVYHKGEDIYAKDYDMRSLRGKVGLVFQYPEHQLFEEDVFKDVCFGPKNMGLSEKEASLAAFEALKAVKLPDECYYVSPFELSGGQKRRVAIAGVLAMKPEILVLDEPTAGLDPEGREEILELVKHLNRDAHITIVLVSHSMDDVAENAGRIIVMDKGRIFMDGTPRAVFSRAAELESIGLSAPAVTYVLHRMRDLGYEVDVDATTVDEAVSSIMKAVSL